MARANIDLTSVLASLGSGPWRVRQVEGGTLGVGFVASGSDRSHFLKTHAAPQGREDLKKECALFALLYAQSTEVSCIEPDDGRTWLITDCFDQLDAEFAPQQALRLIEQYHRKLVANARLPFVSDHDDFELLVREGKVALDDLVVNGHLGQEVEALAGDYITLLEHRTSRFDRRLCHGDLGPNNLMVSGKEVVAIDWEDAFWGFEGYDFLYWLTFFKNRKYLHSDGLGRTRWGCEIEVAVLVLILVLKSYLSLRMGTNMANTLTFDQRILEVARPQSK